MKGLAIIIFIFFQLWSVAYGADGEFAVSNIPADILEHANVIKRMEEIRFDLDNVSKPKMYKKYVLTILNDNGDNDAVFSESYSKFREIASIDGVLYDDKGKKIRSLKKDEIKDLSGVGQEDLIDDHRVKQHSFYCKTYPYTVEYEFEIKYNTSAFFPYWIPQEGYYFGVQQSSISIIFPKSYTIRYKALNYSGEPEKSESHGNNVYSWRVKNLKPIEKEYAAPSWYNLTTFVLFGPSDFQMDNYQGSMSTWKAWGNFIIALTQNRDVLPDNIKKDVHQLTDGLKDTRQKIKVLYEYLQKNTRYISVQIGIGGWQPFDANYVASKKYGDCKALSNYMRALLKEAGIPSYYALIEAGEGEDDIIIDFPSPQFNHATLCVPVGKDSIWLECTSQTKAPGYIGAFTGNRHALLICENDSKIVSTTKYGMNENLMVRKIDGAVDSAGKLNFYCSTKMKGMQQDDIHERINYYSKEKMMEYLKQTIDLPTYDVVKFDYKEDKEIVPTLSETLEITATDYAQVSGKRLFIIPNIVNRIGTKLKMDDTRKYPIEFSAGYRDIDSIEIKIPAGYEPESIPEDLKLESKFGKYVRTTKVLPDKIVYYRLHERDASRFPATDYADLVKFYEQMYKADRSKVVLVKK
ncbi:MAG: DUF3857 domain-containing protein [Bacteroidetes bacterium]|nr:DUF3857 domain-containing protein [Bacteroidota bacterium]